MFEPHTLAGILEVLCDADHAGDLGTRKSRSEMAVIWGSHLIKHGSAVHSTIALSSGESERCALLKVISSCARTQSNAERLTLRSEMRDSHALRQQRGKRHVCSAWIGRKLDMLTYASCGYSMRYRKDV